MDDGTNGSSGKPVRCSSRCALLLVLISLAVLFFTRLAEQKLGGGTNQRVLNHFAPIAQTIGTNKLMLKAVTVPLFVIGD